MYVWDTPTSEIHSLPQHELTDITMMRQKTQKMTWMMHFSRVSRLAHRDTVESI